MDEQLGRKERYHTTCGHCHSPCCRPQAALLGSSAPPRTHNNAQECIAMHSNHTRLVESHKQHRLQQEAEGQVASAPPPHSRLQHQLRAAERPAMSGSGQWRQGSEVRLMHQQQPHGDECPVAGGRTGGRAGRRLTRTGERCTLIRAARLPGDETGTLRSSISHQARIPYRHNPLNLSLTAHQPTSQRAVSGLPLVAR